MQDKDIKVSVVVPVYNASATLTRLLGNLLHQTLDGMEIIIVDDSSTDGSMQIIDDARSQYPDIVQVLRNDKNSGPGVSRNRGIDIARGKYIGFADADDMVDVTMYEELYQAAVNEDADIADCAYMRHQDEGALLQFSSEYCGRLTWGRRSALISMGGYHATKIFRREMLDRYGIRFAESYRLEDLTFLIESLYYARTVAGVPKPLYLYTDTEDSLSNNVSPFQYINDVVAAVAELYSKMSVLPYYAKVQKAVECIATELCKDAVVMAHTIDEPQRSQTIQLIGALYHAVIQIPIDENQYTQEKIPADDLKLLETL